MAKGAGWMTLFTLASRLQGLISMIILARLLVPDDFGIIAMAMSMIAGVELLTAFGFEVVLIQHPDPKAHHFHSAWTMNVILASVAALAAIALAEPIARFFDEPRLTPVMYALSVSAFVNGLENIHVVWFQKNLEFHRDFLFRFLPRLGSFIVTIPLAFYLRSYWALVAGMLFATISSVVLSYYLRPVMPRLSLAGVRDLLGFSKWLFVSNLLGYGIIRGSDIIVGRTLGSFGLGTYSLSFEIATLPTTQLTAPINRAVFPGYPKLASDLNLIRKGFLDVTGVIAAIALPAAIGIAAVAQVLVPVVLGEKWAHTIPLIEILAIYGAVGCLLTNVGPLFNAMARPQLMTYLQILGLMTLLPAVYYLSKEMGVVGAGWAFLLTTFISTPVTIYVVMRLLDFRLSALISIVWRPILAACLMYWIVSRFISSSDEADWVTLVLACGIGAIT